MSDILNLSEYFNDRLQRGLSLNVEWHCRCCNEKHGIDLLRSVARFETPAIIETGAGDFTVDFLFYNAKNLPIFTILLIDDSTASEKIESIKAAAYYGRLQNTPLVLLRTDAVADPAADKVEASDILVDYCLVPRCGVCHQHKVALRLELVTVKCLECREQSIVTVLNDSWGRGNFLIDYDGVKRISPKIKRHARKSSKIETPWGAELGTACERCSSPLGFYNGLIQRQIGETFCRVERLGVEYVQLEQICDLCESLSPVADAEQFVEEVEKLNRDMSEIVKFIGLSQNSGI